MRGATSLSIKVTLYRQRMQLVTVFMEVLIFTKIAKCSFVTPDKLSFDKLRMQHNIRGLPCKVNLELEDTFRRVTTLRFKLATANGKLNDSL